MKKVTECIELQLWYGCKEMNALNYNEYMGLQICIECMEMNVFH